MKIKSYLKSYITLFLVFTFAFILRTDSNWFLTYSINLLGGAYV